MVIRRPHKPNNQGSIPGAAIFGELICTTYMLIILQLDIMLRNGME